MFRLECRSYGGGARPNQALDSQSYSSSLSEVDDLVANMDIAGHPLNAVSP